jgi:hypothetical protein
MKLDGMTFPCGDLIGFHFWLRKITATRKTKNARTNLPSTTLLHEEQTPSSGRNSMTARIGEEKVTIA